jgi:peroxiredoxin
MLRYWFIAVLALATASVGVAPAGDKGKEKDKDLTFKGELTKDDAKDKQRGGPAKTYTVKLTAGNTYTIDLMSKDFDAYLRLLDAKDNQLDEDDDSGGDLNSRIIFNCPKTGEYKIVCTTYGEQMSGQFVMTVKSSSSGVAKTTTTHEALVGKPAPDFQADFALNTKAASLSDLKGKVVVLHFWAMSSDPCIALLPRFREWHKKYKADGLEMVGVSYFPSEIGQRYGFDKETGKTIRVDSADKTSDQALLKTFAAHYKLEFPLLTLAKQQALTAFDAYGVNGIPQVVVIDRKGIIQFVRIGDERSIAPLEAELKRLLAEK